MLIPPKAGLIKSFIPRTRTHARHFKALGQQVGTAYLRQRGFDIDPSNETNLQSVRSNKESIEPSTERDWLTGTAPTNETQYTADSLYEAHIHNKARNPTK